MREADDAHQPINDALTGAYSRALLSVRLREELSRTVRSNKGCSVFLFDVDYFKSVNDAYGHARGDLILSHLVERINRLVRGYDMLFRYGGDEFVLLLPDTGRADATRVAVRLVDGIRSAPFPGQPPLSISVSLGVASFPDDGTDPQSLLATADRRNYLAKSRGRGCAVADDVEAPARSSSSRLLERDLALGTVHEFLTRLAADQRGALRIVGDPGSGHTRFLEEVARAATLRRFTVVDAATAGEPTGTAVVPGGAGVIVVADLGCPVEPAGVVARIRAAAAEPMAVGVVYASTIADDDPAPALAPVLESVELLGWSAAAMRIWLRTALHGEPSPQLVDWLRGHTGGLPAQIQRELDRLIAGDGLVRADDGTVSLAPALATAPARVRSRLPVPLTELVGRERETDQVARLLADRRLITLVGAGGIGKSRLLLAVAATVEDRFQHGVTYVPLGEATSSRLLIATIAQALEIGEVPGEPLAETVAQRLAEESRLLLLDNFEQLIEAAPVVSELLAQAPGVAVLAASRQRLGIYGEQVYQVPPLSLPDPGAALPVGEDIRTAVASSSALALFEARARQAAFDFTVTAQNVAAVVDLCRKLDGLPLGIELAGAHTDLLSPAQILAQLEDHLDLPGEGPRDLPARQRTLRGTIDWSFNLLTPAARRLLSSLGVFAGGCRADAVRAVLGDTGAGGIDDAERLPELQAQLCALADKSLVRTETDTDGHARYALLETIRHFTREMLTEAGAWDDVAARHAEHYAAMAERAGAGLTGPEQGRWAARLEQEYRNLRAAFAWSVKTGRTEPAVRIGLGLWRFWRAGSHLSEGRDWLSRLLDADLALDDRARAQLLHAAAVLAGAQDDHTSATELARESIRRATAAGDAEVTAQASNALGIAALAAGDYAAAAGYFGDSLATCEQLGSALGMAIAHGNLTKVALRTGDIATASRHAARCLELDRGEGNSRGIMLGLLCLGEIRLAQADIAGARGDLTEALHLSRSLGDVFGEAMALHLLGLLARHDGDPTEARRLAGTALRLRHEVGDREDLAISLDVMGELLVDDEAALAVRLFGTADALRTRHRLPQPPEGRADHQPAVAKARDRLGADGFAAHWAAGQAADLAEVVAEAVARAPLGVLPTVMS